MKTSSVGRALIEQYEGLILGAYDDIDDHIVKAGETVRGTLTIGYGHTNSAGAPKVTIGQRITSTQADAILSTDLSKVEADVNNLVKVSINQNQYDALVSFQFNTGALAKSSVLKKLNAKDYQGAADALLLYNRGNGQVLNGLVRRRKSERDLFLKPITGSASTISTKTASAGGVVIAGGAIATQYPNHWIYVVIGTVLIAAVAYAIAHFVIKE